VHGDHFGVIKSGGGSKVVLTASGIEHFRAAAKSLNSSQRLAGAGGGSGADSSKEGAIGGLLISKPVSFDAITQTDDGEIVFDVDTFETEQEAGVLEDVDHELESSEVLLAEAAAANDAAAALAVVATLETSPKKRERRRSSVLKSKLKVTTQGMGAAAGLKQEMDGVAEDDDNYGDTFKDAESGDDEFADQDNDDDARRVHAEGGMPMSHPYLHALHPHGPPPKQWTFDDVLRGAMEKTQSFWGKLGSMVQYIHFATLSAQLSCFTVRAWCARCVNICWWWWGSPIGEIGGVAGAVRAWELLAREARVRAGQLIGGAKDGLEALVRKAELLGKVRQVGQGRRAARLHAAANLVLVLRFAGEEGKRRGRARKAGQNP
jgi:hypothetical protein